MKLKKVGWFCPKCKAQLSNKTCRWGDENYLVTCDCYLPVGADVLLDNKDKELAEIGSGTKWWYETKEVQKNWKETYIKEIS